MVGPVCYRQCFSFAPPEDFCNQLFLAACYTVAFQLLCVLYKFGPFVSIEVYVFLIKNTVVVLGQAT